VKVKAYPVQVKNREEAFKLIASVGADEAGCQYMSLKAVHRLILLEGMTPAQANILKQEMLGKGGEAAVAYGVVNCSVPKTKVLLMGTLRQYQALADKLEHQPFGLAEVAARVKEVLAGLEGFSPYDLNCRGKRLRLGERALVMGILNVTPDSFSDGGLYLDPGRAEERAWEMVEEGADIIDVGGESTRPGHTPVPLEEEISRVIPVVKRLAGELPVPLSVDTSRSEVAGLALEAGAHIINDQWAFQRDPKMAQTVASYGVPVILMHNQRHTEYADLIGDLVEYFEERVGAALKAGIKKENIILDPGFGFGKTPAQNTELLRRLGELRCLGRPLLIGTSRKSTIGKVLDLPVDKRQYGTAATVALAVAGGADIVRVHDVAEMCQVAKMTDAILGRVPLGDI